jgi:hypothetical protein
MELSDNQGDDNAYASALRIRQRPGRLVRFSNSLLEVRAVRRMEYWNIVTKEENEPAQRRPGPSGEMMTAHQLLRRQSDTAPDANRLGDGRCRRCLSGHRWMAHCTDPDGNPFGLFQDDTSAA